MAFLYRMPDKKKLSVDRQRLLDLDDEEFGIPTWGNNYTDLIPIDDAERLGLTTEQDERARADKRKK